MPGRRIVGFNTRLKELKDYKSTYGHCLVPRQAGEYSQLGQWVQKQRTEYKNWRSGKCSSMNGERFQELQALGFVWSIKEQRLKVMVENEKAKERALLPQLIQDGKCTESNSLSRVESVSKMIPAPSDELGFLRKQKSRADLNAHSPPSTGAAKSQSVLDFHQPWEVRFEELKQYKEDMGNCDVPKNYEKNRRLGKWVIKQRYQHRLMMEGRDSCMTEAKVDALNSIGFTWSKRSVDFESRMDELRAYKRRFGDCLVPRKQDMYQQLGDWVQGQRAQYKRWKEGKPSSMTIERCVRLESIGFAWSVNEQWGARLEELQEHLSRQGRSRVPCNIKRNRPLLLWVRRQHRRYMEASAGKPTKLSETQMESLRELGFDEWRDDVQNNDVEFARKNTSLDRSCANNFDENTYERKQKLTRKHDEVSEESIGEKVKRVRKSEKSSSCENQFDSPIISNEGNCQSVSAYEVHCTNRILCSSNVHTPRCTESGLEDAAEDIQNDPVRCKKREVDLWAQERADALKLLGFKVLDASLSGTNHHRNL